MFIFLCLIYTFYLTQKVPGIPVLEKFGMLFSGSAAVFRWAGSDAAPDAVAEA